jgi:iron complex transport system permease protein
METVIFQVRLPRVVAGALVGASLALSGASFQGLFRNPLVSAQILGVTSGAGFGAAIAILLSGEPVLTQVSAFAFGIIAVGLAYLISRTYRSPSTLTLVLAGIIIGALFSALTSLVKYVADPYERLPSIAFWLMGSLSMISIGDVFWMLPPIILGATVLMLIRWRINILSMGEEEAQALGVNVERLKLTIVACSTLMTAAAVSVSGIVGWVGLVIPHIGRMLVGPDHKVLLPASIAIGSSYLMIVDDIARTLTVSEIPLGILTAIVGAPFFAYLMRKRMVGWR